MGLDGLRGLGKDDKDSNPLNQGRFLKLWQGSLIPEHCSRMLEALGKGMENEM